MKHHTPMLQPKKHANNNQRLDYSKLKATQMWQWMIPPHIWLK